MLLFNWCGYRWVSSWMQQHADISLETKLDNNEYDETSLIEIKVSLDLPYQTDWKDFERVDGDIEYNGVHYKYVKRKIQDGYAIYKCIPNEDKHRILSARDQFFKLVNDLQQDQSSKKQGDSHSSLAKNLTGDYDDTNTRIVIAGFESIRLPYHIHYAARKADFLKSTPDQPPEQA